jgi:hypothetical protein
MKLQRNPILFIIAIILIMCFTWQTMLSSSAESSLECDPYKVTSAGWIREYSDNIVNLQPERPIEALVVFMEFEDRKAVETDVKKLLKVSRRVTNFYAQMSEGGVRLNWLTHENTINVRKETIAYKANFRSHTGVAQIIVDVQEILREALDVYEFDFILVVTPSTTSSNEVTSSIAYLDYGEGIVNSAILANDFWKTDGNWTVVAHEIGHAFGLLDLYSVGAAKLISEGNATYFDQFVFMKSYDLMNWPSSSSPSFVMWNRLQFAPSISHRIACFKKKVKLYELVSINSLKPGKKAVLVPLSDSKVLMIEARDSIGVDSKTSKSDLGVITYVVNLVTRSGYGPLRIDCSRASNSKYAECGLKTGQSRLIEGVRVTREESFGVEIRISIVPQA